MEFGLETIFYYGSLGMNKRQIGDLYGYTEDAVGKRLKRAGRLEEFNEVSRNAAEKQLYQDVLKLKRDGLSNKAISKRLNKNEYRIASVLNQAVLNLDIPLGVCLFCKKEHNYSYSRGRYCSEYCARCSSTEHISPESRQKQINTLRSLHRYSVKENDQKTLKPLKLHKRYRRYYEPNMELKRKRTSLRRSESSRAAAQKRIDNGTHKGWTVRGKHLMSYAEKYWASVLDNHGIEYVSEYTIAKSQLGLPGSAAYFLDFAVVTPNGVMIDLEIDGKQHKYPERAASDKIRDDALKRNNIVVYRIEWINSAHDRPTVEKQVKDLLDFFRSHGVC